MSRAAAPIDPDRELDQEGNMDAYITGVGSYLPGDPVGNDEIERYLGATKASQRIRERMLGANGIEKRHYAIDGDGNTVMLNEELAERAVRAALSAVGRDTHDVEMLATGTTQGDLAVPGFASMVHGRLGGGPMEILSAGGVCCSGVAAFRAVEDSVRLGRHRVRRHRVRRGRVAAAAPETLPRGRWRPR